MLLICSKSTIVIKQRLQKLDQPSMHSSPATCVTLGKLFNLLAPASSSVKMDIIPTL